MVGSMFHRKSEASKETMSVENCMKKLMVQKVNRKAHLGFQFRRVKNSQYGLTMTFIFVNLKIIIKCPWNFFGYLFFSFFYSLCSHIFLSLCSWGLCGLGSLLLTVGVGGDGLILWLHHTDMVRQGALRTNLAAGIPGQHDLNLDSKHTLSE